MFYCIYDTLYYECRASQNCPTEFFTKQKVYIFFVVIFSDLEQFSSHCSGSSLTSFAEVASEIKEIIPEFPLSVTHLYYKYCCNESIRVHKSISKAYRLTESMCSVMCEASEKSTSSAESTYTITQSDNSSTHISKKRRIILNQKAYKNIEDGDESERHIGIPEACYGSIENAYNDLGRFLNLDRQIYYELKSEDFRDNSKFRPKWNKTINDVYVSPRYQGYLPEERLKNGPLLESLAKRMAPLASNKTRKACIPHFLINHRSIASRPEHFQGNINYLNFFNREAFAFLHFGRTQDDPAPSFKYSLIAADGSVEYKFLKSGEIEQGIQRTMWRPREKERFFQLLSRYSIHRLDAIHEQLPSKSKAEILTYYNVLKRQLKKVKNSPNNFHDLISMNEMPIAYEMGPEYTKFEESQSRFLLNVVPPEDFARTPINSRKLNQYHLWGCNEDLINWHELSSFGLQIVNPKARKGFEESPDDPLEIKMNTAVKNIPTLTKIMLKDLTVNFVYNLLLGIVESKIAKQTVQKLSYNNRVLMAVTTKDIKKSFHHLTNREFTVMNFWNNFFSEVRGDVPKGDTEFQSPYPIYNKQDEERMRASQHDQNRVNEKKMKSRLDFEKKLADFDTAIANTISFDDLEYTLHDENRTKDDQEHAKIRGLDEHTDESFDLDDSECADMEITTDSEGSLSDIRVAKAKRGRKRKRPEDEFYDDGDRAFVEDDPKTDEELQRSEKLFLMETSLLERLDHEASVKYERLCLGYMLSHPRFVDTNDEELAKFYILQKYYPKELPFYYVDDLPEMKILQSQAADKKISDDREQALIAYVRREEALNKCFSNIKEYEQRLRLYNNLTPEERSKIWKKLEHERKVKDSFESFFNLYHWIEGSISSDSKTGTLNIPLEYDGEFVRFAHYNENDPDETCVFNDITDEMLEDYSYQFSSYDK